MHEVYDASISRIKRQIHWKKLVSDWHKSNLTLKEFCQQEQIKATDLKRWRYRLGKQQKNLTSSFSSQPIAFTPLQLIPEATIKYFDQEHVIELLINQYCVRLGRSFHEETLLRLIHLLRRAA